MVTQETKGVVNPNKYSVNKIVKYVLLIAFLVTTGLLIGLGTSYFFQGSKNSTNNLGGVFTPVPIPLPVNTERSSGTQSSRKMGISYFSGRQVTFCDSPDGTVIEDTDAQGYTNGTKNLITHVYQVENNSVVVNKDLSRETLTYNSPQVYIQQSSSLSSIDENPLLYNGSVNDLVNGDCVIIKNYDKPSKAEIYGFL